jgi:hypothetical protein
LIAVVVAIGFVVFGGGFCCFGRYFSTQHLYCTLRERFQKGAVLPHCIRHQEPTKNVAHGHKAVIHALTEGCMVGYNIFQKKESGAAIAMVAISEGARDP